MTSQNVLVDTQQQVLVAIRSQLDEEIGVNQTLSKEELSILSQKYGLTTPKLTPSERNLILKEERLARY